MVRSRPELQIPGGTSIHRVQRPSRPSKRRQRTERPVGSRASVHEPELRTLTHCHPIVLEQFYRAASSIDIAATGGSKSHARRSARGWSSGCISIIAQSASAGPRSEAPQLSPSLASRAPVSLIRSRPQPLVRPHRVRTNPGRRRLAPGPSLRTFRARPIPLPSPCPGSPNRSSALTPQRRRALARRRNRGDSWIRKARTCLATWAASGPPWTSPAFS